MRRLLAAALLAPILGLPGPLSAATCSCAGVPLLSYLDTSATERGQFFISYVIEDHAINDLVSGSQEIDDETGRQRNSLSQVVSASYAFTDRWSVSALVSYVEHSRDIGLSIIGETTVSGIGDSVVLLRYSPLSITPFSRHQVALGLGARIPTGENDAGVGFIVSEDMQPGMGAMGSIVWASYSYAFNQAATVQLNTSVNYTANEENDREYAFGDDFYAAAGISHRVGQRFAYSAALRYRHADPDRRFGFTVPNTGGQWLDFIPAAQFAFTDRLNVALSGRIPVARELNGALQFTTSYSYALSLTYGF
jgi:hypothetical protein